MVAPLSYEKGTRRTLRRLKFQEERALAKPLAALMAQAVGQWGREFDGVVWVPMSPKKLQQRGYNQSQLLAKALAKELGLPENEEVLMILDLGYAAEGAGPLANHGSRRPLSATVAYL